MAQNRNGSEPFVVCGEKERKAMRGMELWGKSDWVCGRLVKGKRKPRNRYVAENVIYFLLVSPKR